MLVTQGIDMKKISRPEIKMASRKVVESNLGQSHTDIKESGQRGFTTTDGDFVNRTETTKIAKRSGQEGHMESKFLHSSNLKKGSKK